MLVAGSTATLRGAADSWPVETSIITFVPGVIAGIAFTPPVPPTSAPCLPTSYAGVIPSVAQVRRLGAMLVIDWTGCGILQQAPAITGPWTDIYSGASPYSTQHARESRPWRGRFAQGGWIPTRFSSAVICAGCGFSLLSWSCWPVGWRRWRALYIRLLSEWRCGHIPLEACGGFRCVV